MASKRAFGSIPCIAWLPSVAPARAPVSLAALRARRQPPVPVSIPSTTVRLAHGIPRPRSRSPFSQQPPIAGTASSISSPPSSETSQSATPSTTTSANPSSEPSQQPAQAQNNKKPNIRQQPHYELTFTCRPCGERSRHRVSKQGYHYGSVLIACPGCRNRHVISDHLRIFGDTSMTVEDILRQRGELVKRGTLGEDEDLEFWEDGTTTVREPWPKPEAQQQVNDDAPPGSTFQSVSSGEGGKA